MQDLNDKITGSTLTATEWNEVPSELQNVIENLGLTLSSGDLNQLGKAIAGYVANGTFYTDSGAADAYVLTTIGLKQSPTAYTDGLEINFLAANPCTGGAVTVNVAGLGVKNIKLSGGANPGAGDITGRSNCVFDLANDWFELTTAAVVAAAPDLAVFTTSGSYSKPAGLLAVEVTVVGGGGGGGGAAISAVAGGGGGGGAAIEILLASALSASETVTIGAGGAGGSSGVGGTGGTTSFGAFLSATGGVGGGAGNAQVEEGGAGGIGSGGDLNLKGNGGGGGAEGSGSGEQMVGAGGGSLFGGGGAGQTHTTTKENGLNGGGGSGREGGTGGTGGNGIVFIREYF